MSDEADLHGLWRSVRKGYSLNLVRNPLHQRNIIPMPFCFFRRINGISLEKRQIRLKRTTILKEGRLLRGMKYVCRWGECGEISLTIKSARTIIPLRRKNC